MSVIDLAELRLWFAFTAGVATFFAPCAYPMLPAYVAYFIGEEAESTTSRGGSEIERFTRLVRAGFVGGLASLGFFAVYSILAIVVLAVGTGPLSNIVLLELVVGSLLVVLGVVTLSGRLPSRVHVLLPERRRTPLGMFLFGVAYAAAAAGCTAPVFVGVALVALSAGPMVGVATILVYAGGMSLLLLCTTAIAALGYDSAVNRIDIHVGRLERLAGVMLIVAGIAQLYLFLFVFGGRELLGLA